MGDCALELVRHQRRRHAAVVFEGPAVAGDEVRALLCQRRFGVGVARGSQHRHEELDLLDLSRLGIHDAGLLARVVDEELLSASVDLPHRKPTLHEPPAVVLAELRVPVAVRLSLPVLHVQQLERDSRALALLVDHTGSGSFWRRR